MASPCAPEGPELAASQLLVGALLDELLSAAGEYEVDLIILGTHGRRGFDRLVFGSETEAVVEALPLPCAFCGTCRTGILRVKCGASAS